MLGCQILPTTDRPNVWLRYCQHQQDEDPWCIHSSSCSSWQALQFLSFSLEEKRLSQVTDSFLKPCFEQSNKKQLPANRSTLLTTTSDQPWCHTFLSRKSMKPTMLYSRQVAPAVCSESTIEAVVAPNFSPELDKSTPDPTKRQTMPSPCTTSSSPRTPGDAAAK